MCMQGSLKVLCNDVTVCTSDHYCVLFISPLEGKFYVAA